MCQTKFSVDDVNMFLENSFDQICLKTDQICLNHFLKWFFGIMAKQLIRQTALTTDEEVYD